MRGCHRLLCVVIAATLGVGGCGGEPVTTGSDAGQGHPWDATTRDSQLPGASCTDGDPASIVSQCAALHRACVPGAGGATCGACRADATGCWVGPAGQADGACRAPRTCSQCGDNRQCTRASGCGDDLCGDCVASFVPDPGGMCRPGQAATECALQQREFVPAGASGFCGACLVDHIEFAGRCVLPTCDGTAGSLGALCAGLGRACSGGSPPSCAPCAAGTVLGPDGVSCVPSGSCGPGNDCPAGAGLYCLQLSTTDDPQCRPAPCSSGQTWDRVSRSCKSCSCPSGQPWPVSNRDGNCYCAGGPGTYYNRPKLQVLECDSDRDGWLSKEVQDALTEADGAPLDYTVLLNTRCPITVASEVWLQNEWGQTHPLSLQADVRLPGGTTALPLFEHPDNDTGANAALAAVPNAGTPLSAAAVNSLTKVCWDETLDMNRNGQYDLDEDQGVALTQDNAWAQPYQRLTHFAETHKISFVKTGNVSDVAPCVGCKRLPIAGAAGRLVIEERKRCAGFPFEYVETDPWWKSCTRRRDGAYLASAPLGYDFAAFDCATPNGACGFTWGPLWTPRIPAVQDPTYPNPPPEALPPPLTQLPVLRSVPHGVCDGALPPASPWRGMTHHSQFRCAKVVSSGANKRNQIDVTDVATSGGPSGTWEAQRCRLAGETSSAPLPGRIPDFACQVDVTSTVPAGSVGWFARRFRPYSPDPKQAGAYPGGCIDEGTEWNLMCPGDRKLAIGNRSGFGRLICGPPCPSSEAFYSDRTWICGHTSASGFTDGTLAYTSSSYTLAGEVPTGGNTGTSMSSASCVPGGGGSCYTLR